MDEVRTRGLSSGVLAIAMLTACVPEPANRASRSPVAEVTATPVVTPAGPTPTPSFVRPTPKPQPTFFVYTVVSGDSLGSIAKRYGTSPRSLAYWNRATYPSLDPDSATYKPNYLAVGWTLRLIPNSEVDPENLPPPPPASAEPASA